jgi:deoxyribose-phosphate aldolase
VRTLPALLEVIDAGVTRCGATATAKILDDFKALQEGREVESKLDATPGAY